jgi:hypothetical protein
MRASGALLIAMLAAAAWAGDPPAPAGDSIADAKKDLATIKVNVGQQDSGAALPTLDMKDVSPGPAGGRLEVPEARTPDKETSLDPAKKKEGTGNWLVDAMDKKSDRSAGSKARDKDDLLKGDADPLRGDKDASTLEETRDKAGPREEAQPVYNPLDSFMGGWVSARDHDLLLPSSRGDGLPLAGLERAHADTLPGLDLGQGGAPGEGLFAAPEGAAPGDSRAGSNPYFAALDLSSAPQAKAFFSPEGPGSNPFGLPDLSSGVSSMGAAAKPADSEHSYVPDFALPPDDDKYFKQMKRF